MFEEAASHFREYLEARPDDVSAMASLGIALVASGKTDEAISVFRRAVEVDPEDEAAFQKPIKDLYDAQSSALYASARCWDDGIVEPKDTRVVLGLALRACMDNAPVLPTKFGVFRM